MMAERKDLRLIVYGDERTSKVARIEGMFLGLEIPYTVIPVEGIVPTISGPGAQRYDTSRDGGTLDLLCYLRRIKQQYFIEDGR